MVTLKTYMKTNQSYYSQTLIVEYLELKLKISMKILAAINKFLISEIIPLSQSTMIIEIN